MIYFKTIKFAESVKIGAREEKSFTANDHPMKKDEYICLHGSGWVELCTKHGVVYISPSNVRWGQVDPMLGQKFETALVSEEARKKPGPKPKVVDA